ncbi:unnamed protein product [Arctogadus glacialis]
MRRNAQVKASPRGSGTPRFQEMERKSFFCHRTRDIRGKERVLKGSEASEEFEPKLSKQGGNLRIASHSRVDFQHRQMSRTQLLLVFSCTNRGLTRVRRRALGVWTLSGSVCLSAGRLPGAACIMEDAGRAVWIMGGRGIPADSDAWPSRREIMFFALSSMSTSPAQI